MKFRESAGLLAGLAMLAGCHSAYIAATVSNRSNESLSLIEVDYPSASFGTQTLAPGQDFSYRFKVLGSGPATILWSANSGHNHRSSGPTLREGDDGKLTIIFGDANTPPAWHLALRNRVSGT